MYIFLDERAVMIRGTHRFYGKANMAKFDNETAAAECLQVLNAFFTRHPNPQLQAWAMGSFQKLLKRGVQLTGSPAGWMAGLVYAVANHGKRPCGVDGLLNAEFTEAFGGVSMSTVRSRAATIQQMLDM